MAAQSQGTTPAMPSHGETHGGPLHGGSCGMCARLARFSVIVFVSNFKLPKVRAMFEAHMGAAHSHVCDPPAQRMFHHVRAGIQRRKAQTCIHL